jgi:hypothetical protein
MQNPKRLMLSYNQLLNFSPSEFFGTPVNWRPPASFNCSEFMARYVDPMLAPYTDRIRITTDGRINVKASSGVWVRLFGIGYNLRKPYAPLAVTNQVRPQELTDQQLINFLEMVG